MVALVGDRREYERFVARTASQAYARCFVITNDFVEARALLEKLLIEELHSWRAIDDSRYDAFLDQMMAKAPSSIGSASREVAPYSFSGARKIQEAQEATALLASFEPSDRVVLFLQYVEEMPEASLCRITHRTSAELADLALRLDREIAKWRPDDPEALDLFSRILRQHRLPSNFPSRVMSRTTGGALKSGFMFGIFMDGLRVTLLVVVVASVLAWMDWRRGSHMISHEVDFKGQLNRIVELTWPLWVDFFVLAASFVLTTNLAAHDIQKARYRGLRLLQTLGLLCLTLLLYAFARRHSFLHTDPGALLLMFWSRILWVIPTFAICLHFMVSARMQPQREAA